MAKVYTYRLAMRVTNSAPMRAYDAQYQCTNEGAGIAWVPGITWPSITAETGTGPYLARQVAAAADIVIARIMLRAKVEWEKQHDRH